MISIFIDYYLEGMLVGAGTMLALGGLCLIVYFKEKKRKQFTTSPDYSRPGTTGNMAKKAATEASVYIGASFVLIIVLYAWITPIFSYSGVVEDKYTRQNSRKWPRTNHYLVVNGRKRWVDENIYDRSSVGDTIVHPFGQQSYHINGTNYMADTCAWNTGYWSAIVLSTCLFLCVGAFYRRMYIIKKNDIMKH